MAQVVGGIERVRGFVPQDAPQPLRVAALDLLHDATFETLQARIGEIERHCESGHAIGREPLGPVPGMRPEADAACTQFRIQPAQLPCDLAAADVERQVAEAQLEQLLVIEAAPVPVHQRTIPPQREKLWVEHSGYP